MGSLTYKMTYATCEVTIVGIELTECWHLAVEVCRPGRKPVIWRDRRSTFPDFQSLRSHGVLWAKRFIDEGAPYQQELMLRPDYPDPDAA